MKEEKGENSFTFLGKSFHNWIEKVDMTSKVLKAKFSEAVIGITESPEVLTDLEKQRSD